MTTWAQGEELTLGYVELYAARAERRAGLRASKGFDCGCRRCAQSDAPAERRLTQVGERRDSD